MMLLAATAAEAQGTVGINIGGKVFGGARQANVGGHTFVDIGADNHDVVISAVYGGNDISGTIGRSIGESTTMPITPEVNSIDKTYNAFIRTNPEATGKHLFIGQLFGGGYGNYKYSQITEGDNKNKYKVTVHGTTGTENEVVVAPAANNIPNLDKSYLELKGGTFAYVYGGGDSVTVAQKTDIRINNTSTPWVLLGNNANDPSDDVISDAVLHAMGINIEYFDQTGKYHFSRVFGGNNKTDMTIRPTWHLQAGKIENLYSGGNEGRMTSDVGLLLEINPEVPDGATAEQTNEIMAKLRIENVYGGCRKADVHPLNPAGGEVDDYKIKLEGYGFPEGLAARVLVRGGTITNVYGGNDVKGRVYGGNAIGVYSSISGSIFGGGNGSYPYTDNAKLKNSLHYGDFYYDVPSGKTSVQALNETRPNAEQVSIRVVGKETGTGNNRVITPTVIGGAIYCGGNSATLKTDRRNPRIELKIGSHVIAERVFLGNNGEDMIKYTTATDNITDKDVLNRFKQYVNADGSLTNTIIAGSKFNSMDLTNAATFSEYMDGCAMDLPVSVKFDGDDPDDPAVYEPYSTYFGSFFCGGNVGSMTMSGKSTINFNRPVIVYSKVVGGCNDAYVEATDYNAAYQGGIIGSIAERPLNLSSDPRFVDGSGNIRDRLELNFNGLKIQPLRMPKDGIDDVSDNVNTIIPNHIPLVWNTIKLGERDAEGSPVPVAWNKTWNGYDALQATMNRRFNEGNIYGGCCNSGVVNGNVVININETIVDRTGEHGVFDVVDTDDKTGEDKLYGSNYTIKTPVSGVILGKQGMDVLGSALNIFGGGKGQETEIWGSTTINLNRGYVFQIFGGSEQGAIGKRKKNNDGTDVKDVNGRYVYEYNSKYSTYVNLSGSERYPGVPKSDMNPNIAEAEFLYGGGFAGPIAGNTRINLDNGRIFNSFAGSCNADIQGHTETIIGANGFPYVRDYVYGGNDLGGKILGEGKFWSNVRDNDDDNGNGNGHLAMVHGYNASNEDKSDVLNASAYIEYHQGRAEKIFGGCYGVYDYADPLYGDYFYARGGTGTTSANLGQARTDKGYSKPFLGNAFINFRPVSNSNPLNTVGQIFGAGQGYLGEKEENLLQNSSYILIDIPQSMKSFQGTVVFGAGECGGVGMGVDKATADAAATADKASAIVDLFQGEIMSAYGGSYKEGVTRRTVVNVPEGSTIAINSIFGGAYGTSTYHPCDVYEANVNYWGSETAKVTNAIYGGNNNERRTIYGKVNIYGPVYSGVTSGEGDNLVKYTSTVYGAGRGKNTWSEYTEVNLEDGASVYEVYGGGQAGKVRNAESVQHYMNTGKPTKWLDEDGNATNVDFTNEDWKYAWTLGGGYDPTSFDFSDIENNPITTYVSNEKTNLNNSLARTAEVDNRATKTYKYNTNVIIKRGATVSGYAYGGGLGEDAVVAGTTYIALLGGKVMKDVYAAGTSGSVEDLHQAKNFIASANAYIEGGSLRNVYGGGWKGSVGHHTGGISDTPVGDIPGETHVVIGKLKGDLAAAPGNDPDFHFYNGVPTVERNAYGGGEGGAVWGTTHVVMNNGYIGYHYQNGGYEEKIEDETYRDADGHFQANIRLDDAGCIFGGGYIDNSSVDFTHVSMFGGHVRNALFGGGEIAAIGRGQIHEEMVEGKAVRSLENIYRPGGTHVELFDGHVHRNIFGGGRGYNNLGEGGHLFSDGYVFGQTEVHIHGGEVGTDDGVELGYGNVFGGGDIGYVYSAYEMPDGTFRKGVKGGSRYDGLYEGYYYDHVWDNDTDDNQYFITDETGEREFTEDCKVLVEPHCKVKTGSLSFTIKYVKKEVVSEDDLAYLRANPTANQTALAGIDANGKVTADDGISFTRTFAVGEYVPTSALNTLGNKSDPTWASLEANTNDDGIIIHNAVFAGGNTSSKGNDNENYYANTTSVYGNATASIHDVYHRDLITIGTGHTGGLYGDGNLTKVDGYRGLNITNYGTDYYYFFEEQNLKEMSYDDYQNNLLEREQAYYELRYKCVQDCQDDDKTNYYAQSPDHPNASTLTADDIKTLFKNGTYTSGVINSDGTINSDYWVQNGVCSIYAGRIMNTIQRADFCGVFGSRMVMQGAQDRVPEVVDYTKYTINRVREVSLNKKVSVIAADANVAADSRERSRKQHGNYFGIYSVVNYLGALTSDFDFGGTNDSYGDVRTSDNIDTQTYGPQSTGQTFYGWKENHKNGRERNNGNSHNKVALASGVYLELTTEKGLSKDLYEKDWGLITGVIELDLINVQQGMGGGFVYAKNVHGVRTKTNHTHTTLTALNSGAVTQWDYEYAEPSLTSDAADANQKEWQTSGNFVHSTQIIIDDCYNVSNQYKGTKRVPAHYWYIKGSVYVYDQYISAYTGATNAYSEKVDLPLTITAASHGRMKLLNVQPNKYAYYANSNHDKLTSEQKLVINNVEYNLNSPISYWDWYKLSAAERALFVDKTYVTTDSCKIGEHYYPSGYVMLPTEYHSLETVSSGTVTMATVDKNGNSMVVTDENGPVTADFTDVFHESNNLSHNTGYILTYTVNNPPEWNTWYTPKDNTTGGKIAYDKYTNGDVNKNLYEDGPTYRLKSNTGTFLGQRDYKVSDMISNDVYSTYQTAIATYSAPANQAEFERAYVATTQIDIQRTLNNQTATAHLNSGSPLSATEAAPYISGSGVAEAFICTKTIQLSATENIYIHSVMTAAEKNKYISDVTSAIQAIKSSLTASRLDNVNTYNDLTADETDGLTAMQKKELSELILRRADMRTCIVEAYYCTQDGKYGGNYYVSGKNYRGLEAWSSMSETDRNQFEFNYDALDLLIDPLYGQNEGEKYQYDAAAATLAAAQANPAGYSIEQHVDYTATYNGTTGTYNGYTLTNGQEFSREQFEALPNEQRHYTPLTVLPTDVEGGKKYTFYMVNTPLLVGPTPYAVGATITKEEYDILVANGEGSKVTPYEYTSAGIYYICREAYTPVNGGGEVSIGTQISSADYEGLINLQKDFTIHGIAPTETSTLYVSLNSDINDLSKEKIITVVYEYNYEESDISGLHITPICERHVVNIHIEFKTGAPTIEDIKAPQIILPGDYLGMTPPNVIEGASPIQGGGWELFKTETDAESHNGIPYTPNTDPLYWYQHGYWLRYYVLSHIGGKTYSNKVQVSVANSHDLKKVLEDKEHHYYVDIPDLSRLRPSKIYINDAENGAQQLKDLFDLSLLTVAPTSGTLNGHATLDPQVRACNNLEFIMRTNVNHKGSWASIAKNTGDTDPCFEGVLHGDGHYISGLSESLFGKLCGEVYNLGVMGSFTGAGIAEKGGIVSGSTTESGYVENCWVGTSSTEAKTSKPVFGEPYTDNRFRIVNSYYMEDADATNKYPVHEESSGYGVPTRKDKKAFYNGEVAYDLNGFYLYKRYRDNASPSGASTSYKNFTADNQETPVAASYGTTDAKYCSSGYTAWEKGYVEDRYADGDFRYARGEIPTEVDERLYIDVADGGKTKFYPIWPDDYIFFGQMLTYDWNELRPHEEVPSPIVKNNGRLATNDETNRVYRAPAYYGNSTMAAAHFNPNVNLVAYSKPKNAADKSMKAAYPGMTAIDFEGHTEGHSSEAYKLGLISNWFYQPLLDDDGLESIVNRDETHNLLVYAPLRTSDTGYANQKTYDVLTSYFTEPAYSDYDEASDNYTDGKTYNRVWAAPTSSVFGHLVMKNLTTESDHLLVDKEDFDCPISYTMGSGYRMWYQRLPGNYVEPVWTGSTRSTKGWEAVSLPFTAELVTTVKKGEITHFYSGSKESKNDTNTKLGHEYWLRLYRDISEKTTAEEKAEALFTYPASSESTTMTKEMKNSFLWDYYYNNVNALSGNEHLDKNLDTYQTYYKPDGNGVVNTFTDYALLTKAKPYIIGFPGKTFYEFDLSGNFDAKTTADDNPDKLLEQTITFASPTGTRIDVSDGEKAGVTHGNYTFKPSYLNKSLAAGTNNYSLSDDGSSFDKVPDASTPPAEPVADTKVYAFRPYFTASGSGARPVTRSIVFSNDDSELKGVVEHGDPTKDEAGTLNIYAKKHKIIVESALGYTTDVRIVSLAGVTINAFTIEPGETVETRVNISGVYIVQTSDGRYTKKLAVK